MECVLVQGGAKGGGFGWGGTLFLHIWRLLDEWAGLTNGWMDEWMIPGSRS